MHIKKHEIELDLVADDNSDQVLKIGIDLNNPLPITDFVDYLGSLENLYKKFSNGKKLYIK